MILIIGAIEHQDKYKNPYERMMWRDDKFKAEFSILGIGVAAIAMILYYFN